MNKLKFIAKEIIIKKNPCIEIVSMNSCICIDYFYMGYCVEWEQKLFQSVYQGCPAQQNKGSLKDNKWVNLVSLPIR